MRRRLSDGGISLQFAQSFISIIEALQKISNLCGSPGMHGIILSSNYRTSRMSFIHENVHACVFK